MAQHDYSLADAVGATFRADTNDALAAIVSNNSGATEPATKYAYQWWADTTTGLLKIRNAANNAWVTVGTLASANLGLAALGVAAGNAVQVDQSVTAWTRAATTTLGTSLNGTLSDTSTTITAFNGVAGVTYHVRCLGAGSITHHATDLIITQGLASITTAAGDTFDVEMLMATTCRIKNYVRSVGESLIHHGTAVATTSGTSINFTGIPTGIKRLTFMFSGVSTNGTSIPILRIGNNSVETTGYLGGNAGNGISRNQTVGVGLSTDVVATTILHGAVIATLLDSSTNLWCFHGDSGRSDAAQADSIGYSKSITGVLNIISLTTVNGTDAFDAGSINIQWEF